MPPAFTDPSLSEARIIGIAQGNYRNLIQAIEMCQDFDAWISQFAAADLVSMYGFTSSTAGELLTSAADSNSLAVVFNGGTFAAGLPYNFSASIRQVTGPMVNGA